MKIKLNAKEEHLLKVLNGAAEPLHLTVLAHAWDDQRGGSWARNSLRKLVKERLVRKVGRGIYQVPAAIKAKPKKRSSGMEAVLAPQKSRPPEKRTSIAERIMLAIYAGPQTDAELASRLMVPQPSIRRARKTLGSRIVRIAQQEKPAKWGAAS